MLDMTTLYLFIGSAIFGLAGLVLKVLIEKAGSVTKFQTYSNSADESLMDSGIFTNHGIVYDSKTQGIVAHHKRSELYYENV